MKEKMVVHLNGLGPGVKGGFLRKLDDVKVVRVDRCWIGHLYLQILE